MDEAIILWRMRRADGSETHAVLGPRADGAIIVWFINSRPIGFREFNDWSSALSWGDRLQHQNWASGWRHAPDEG